MSHDENQNEGLETPAFERSKSAARTRIVIDGYGQPDTSVDVKEPYRTVRGRLNEARTHFEVTLSGRGVANTKMLISVANIKSVQELN